MNDVLNQCSTQFVLGHDAPLVKNLAALWCVDARLAARLEALADEQEYAVDPTRDGHPTVRVPTEDGRTIYLHSRYHPIDEANRLIDSVDTQSSVAFYILGLGMGYHLQALFDRVGDEAITCVMEPDLRLIRTALRHRDLSRLILSNRVLFFTQTDRAELLSRLSTMSAVFTLGFTPVVHAPSIEAHRAFHATMRQGIEDFLGYAKTSINTLLLTGRRTAENIARNIGWYLASPGVNRLAGCFKGKPAVVVSAGPSLQKNKHLLKNIQDRAVIVTVQTALRPLLEIGVEPHFVTSLDYHEICTRFFENLPTGIRTELVAEPKATDRIFSMFPGPVTLLGNELAESLLAELKLERGRLRAGATVAHLAYYLAEHMGCDPIIFIGQDLGFSDGLCYAPGTSYEDVWRPELGRFCTMEMKQWEQIVRDRPILRRVQDIHGGMMYTEQRLFTYLQQFERDFAATSTRIIDATQGGAKMAGTQIMDLSDAITRYCGQTIQRLADHPGLDESRLAKAIECLRQRQADALKIEQISADTLPLLREIVDHPEDRARINRAIARIDVLRDQMNHLGRSYDLIMQLSQNTELDRFKHDRRIVAERLDGQNRQQRQVMRDLDNVRSVQQAAREFQTLMDDVCRRLERPLIDAGASRGAA